jgi:nesprin-1
LYEKEKEMVERHELFMEAGNDFMAWLRMAKEKLAKCSEPTGDKDSLATKVTQIRCQFYKTFLLSFTQRMNKLECLSF